jgi:hypothetical protein
MTELITQESDPVLWAGLKSSLISEGYPGHVNRGGKLYKALTKTTEEIAFMEIDTMDYMDSRSLKNSKKASYNNLKK